MRRTCTVLPVWKAHHTNTAEKQTASLSGSGCEFSHGGRRGNTHTKPVIKQNAASGRVDWAGSTSVIKYSFEKIFVGIQSSEDESWLSGKGV